MPKVYRGGFCKRGHDRKGLPGECRECANKLEIGIEAGRLLGSNRTKIRFAREREIKEKGMNELVTALAARAEARNG